MSEDKLVQANSIKKMILTLEGKLEEINLFFYDNKMNNSKITSFTVNSNTENFVFKRSIVLPVEYFTVDLKAIKIQLEYDIKKLKEAFQAL